MLSCVKPGDIGRSVVFLIKLGFVEEGERGRPWPGSSVGESTVPVCHSCDFVRRQAAYKNQPMNA